MRYLPHSLLLILAWFCYSCGTESSVEEGFYLHSNDVTIMCPNTQPGDKGIVEGVEYESVNNTILRSHIDRGSDLSKVCVSLIEDYPDLFYETDSKMFGQSIGNWDVSNMTTMINWFRSSAYNQDISHWDVSNVTNMNGMFYGSFFNQPIENWDVSNVYDMNNMFERSIFNQPIEKWDVSSVTGMRDMFRYSSFNKPLENWNVENVMSMNRMFEESEFNQPINSWCVEQITEEPDFFSDGSPLKEENKPDWGTCPSN